jgi:protein TonB
MKSRFLLSLAIAAISTTCSTHVISQTADASHSAIQIDPQAPLGSAKNPVRVSSGVIAGLAISQPKPLIGPISSGVKTSGATVIRALISPEGKVDRLEVISGPEVLRKPVLDAVRQWTYKPYLLNGTAVWVQTTITMYIDFGG